MSTCVHIHSNSSLASLHRICLVWIEWIFYTKPLNMENKETVQQDAIQSLGTVFSVVLVYDISS